MGSQLDQFLRPGVLQLGRNGVESSVTPLNPALRAGEGEGRDGQEAGGERWAECSVDEVRAGIRADHPVRLLRRRFAACPPAVARVCEWAHLRQEERPVNHPVRSRAYEDGRSIGVPLGHVAHACASQQRVRSRKPIRMLGNRSGTSLAPAEAIGTWRTVLITRREGILKIPGPFLRTS
jgi:hypothetical protein